MGLNIRRPRAKIPHKYATEESLFLENIYTIPSTRISVLCTHKKYIVNPIGT